jgi:hypothetical protein
VVTPCQRPAIRGRTRCRLHGGLSPGAPCGSKNGNFKNGDWTAEAIEERKWLRSLVKFVCQDGERRMTNKTNNSLTPLADQPKRPPVRVKLRRVRANLATAYPPDGESKAWWRRLKKALGTTSSDFVNTSLLQLQGAAQLPGSGISEIALNAALISSASVSLFCAIACRSAVGSTGVALMTDG